MLLPWFYVLIKLSIYVHLDEGALVVYALICWGILSTVFTVLSLTVFKQSYIVLLKKLHERIFVVVFATVLIFVYSFVCISTINTGFTSERHSATYQIVEKEFRGGGKAPKKHLLYIIYNDKKIGIDVSIDVYKEKSVGESLDVYSYSGFLSVSYIASAE
jgi:hypothetical protein